MVVDMALLTFVEKSVNRALISSFALVSFLSTKDNKQLARQARFHWAICGCLAKAYRP